MFQAPLQRMGFTQPAVAAMMANGITTTQDLIGLDDKDVEQILKIIRVGPPPILVPYIAQKRLNILCYWTSRRHQLNEPIDAALFNAAAIDTYSKMMTFEAKKKDTIVKAPAEFKAGTKWKSFKEGTIAYLNSIKGMHIIPLAYVIREDEAPPPNQVYQSEHHRLISITPLLGIEFEEDIRQVFDLLKSWTLNGPAWTWMRAYSSTRKGRQAWIVLIAHFEGDAQRDRVKDHTYAAISSARYFGDCKKFSFEMYVTIHQESYSDLEQYGEIVSEEKRVRDLLTGIKDNYPATNTAKGTILATPNLRNSFFNAVTHLSTTLQLSQSLQDPRNISASNTAGRSEGGRGRSRNNNGRGRSGRGGRGRGRGRNIYLGSYSLDQWRKLSPEDKKRVIESRQKSADQNTIQGGGTARNLSSVIVTTTDVDNQSHLTGAVGTLAQLQSVDQSILQGTLHGSAAVGDKRNNTELAGSQMTRRRINVFVTSKHSGNRNIWKITQRKHEIGHDTIHGPCELDSHGDTCVAGSNCVVIESTNQTVSVSAFTDTHEVIHDVPIVTAATAYDDPITGITYILILGQSIYMGDRMQTSLLCPNQLRANNIVVDDIPKHLAPQSKPSTHSIICNEEDLVLPLSLKGVISYIDTRTPNQEELDTCKWIVLTDEHDWDPHLLTHCKATIISTMNDKYTQCCQRIIRTDYMTLFTNKSLMLMMTPLS